MIIYGGCGLVCAEKFCTNWKVGPLGAPLVFGTAVAVAVYGFRDISGAHFNPAITASLAINRPEAIPKAHVIPYMAAQMAGATWAAGVNYLVYKRGIEWVEKAEGLKRGAPGSEKIFNGAFGLVPNRHLIPKMWMLLACEIGITAALAFCIYGFTDPSKKVPHNAVPAMVGTAVFILAA